jgi:hypothetical protein
MHYSKRKRKFLIAEIRSYEKADFWNFVCTRLRNSGFSMLTKLAVNGTTSQTKNPPPAFA